MSESAIITQSLGKKYGRISALNDFSFQVEQGDIHALVGSCGSGKTTVLNILAGTVRASGGSGRIFSQRVGSREARKNTGYVSAKTSFYSSLTVMDYLVFMGMITGIGKSEVIFRAEGLLKGVDLYSFRNKKPDALTSGMKKKIAIVQGFISRPGLVLIDEPVSGLDETGKNAILRIIRDLALKNAATVLLSANIWTDVESVADRMTVIDSGKLILSTETNKLGKIYENGVFFLNTSNNEMVIADLQRLPFIKQIIQNEKKELVIITKEKEKFRRVIPGIINDSNIELFSFREEEASLKIITDYLSDSWEEE